MHSWLSRRCRGVPYTKRHSRRPHAAEFPPGCGGSEKRRTKPSELRLLHGQVMPLHHQATALRILAMRVMAGDPPLKATNGPVLFRLLNRVSHSHRLLRHSIMQRQVATSIMEHMVHVLHMSLLGLLALGAAAPALVLGPGAPPVGKAQDNHNSIRTKIITILRKWAAWLFPKSSLPQSGRSRRVPH